MPKSYTEGQTFLQTDFSAQPLSVGEYQACDFTDCDFSGADLSEIIFTDCRFERCNLSLVKLPGAAFRDVRFGHCKMLGWRFEDCNQFGLAVVFSHCALDHSSFYRVVLKKTVFQHCRLLEVDFTETDLSSATFNDCDLSGATFENANLEKADLRTAMHYHIDPEKNRIKKARFSLAGTPGLLNKYDIVIE